jgi:hypothetical protein
MNKKLKRMAGGFSASEGQAKAKEFFSSNSIVAKFAFLIFIIMMFILLLRLGTSLIAWFLEPKQNPIVVKGMVSGSQALKIPQKPGLKGSIPILRSKNDATGMEFTWSTWLYIEDSTFSGKVDCPASGATGEQTDAAPEGSPGDYIHLFSKGNGTVESNGLINPNNAPGVYLSPITNKLTIIMNTFDKPTRQDIDEFIDIDNIPINKWINVIIRVSKQRQLDVYINGSLIKRHTYKGVPRQNYGDILVSQTRGWDGYLSELRYFNTGIGTAKIQSIVDDGPNMKLTSETSSLSLVDSKPNYLSTKWYFSGITDLYNP